MNRDTNSTTQDEHQGSVRDEAGREQSRWTWIIPLALLTLLVSLYFVWPGYRDFLDRAFDLIRQGDQQALQDWVRGFGFWGPLLILALMIAQTLLAFIPSVLVMVVAVLAYGPWWGGLLAWGGLLLAASVAYLIGRVLGPVTIDRLLGHKAEQKVAHYVECYGVWAIIAARISPALSTDAVSYVAGLLRMRYERFLLATATGILPLAGLISFLGEDIERLGTGLIWVSVVSLAIFVGYVIIDHLRRGGPAEVA